MANGNVRQIPPAPSMPAPSTQQVSDAVRAHIQGMESLVADRDRLAAQAQDLAAKLAAATMKVSMLLEEVVSLQNSRDFYYRYATEMSTTFRNIKEMMQKVLERGELAASGTDPNEDKNLDRDHGDETARDDGKPIPSFLQQQPIGR